MSPLTALLLEAVCIRVVSQPTYLEAVASKSIRQLRRYGAAGAVEAAHGDRIATCHISFIQQVLRIQLEANSLIRPLSAYNGPDERHL